MPTTTPQPAAMDANSAAMVRYSKVYLPAFWQKLASLGMAPRTEAEATNILAINDRLLLLRQQEAEKTAAAQSDVYAQLLGALDRQLGQPTPTALDNWIKQAAAQAAQTDPELAQACLVPHIPQGQPAVA